MRTVLEGKSLPGYDGIGHGGGERTPWDHDDAANFLKHGLCQIEVDRREAIAERYDQQNEISKGSVEDVWKPLKDVAENLLPHLSFEKIDSSNRDEIKCLWRVHGSETLVDIDDLSSGEKSVIQLFYPIIEHNVKRILRSIKGSTSEESVGEICVLIDEPELHLHPNLQDKILDYLRTLSTNEMSQFIVATHSPTIVESANSDELYLLRPAEFVQNDENQLIKIASDEEKLNVLREVFGSTSNLTAMRPIVVVEGKLAERNSKRASDARIYAFLSDEFSRVTLLPSGGKTECRAIASILNCILKDFSENLEAFALLDRDLEDRDAVEDNIYLLPVSMIENLLVDPLVLWEATHLVRHKIKLESYDKFEMAIDEILETLTDEEVGRRVKARVGRKEFRLSDPIETAENQIEEFTRRLKEEISPKAIERIIKDAQESVEDITKKQKRREFFHGKRILDEFYRRHIHDSGMSKEIFIYECARCASERLSVQRFVDDLMKSLKLRQSADVR